MKGSSVLRIALIAIFAVIVFKLAALRLNIPALKQLAALA